MSNTLNAMIAEAAKIAAAHKAAPSPEHVQAMHDLHENAKQVLTREDYAVLWEHICPKASGVKDFAGKGWKRNHPDAPASVMPKCITDAQEKRKAEKAAQPKAEGKPASKPKTERKAASKPAAKTTQPKAEPTKATSKRPTYTDTLLAVVNVLERMDKRLANIENALK